MLDAIADPVRLRIVRHIDDRGPASLSELAQAAGVHVNTVRPHVVSLEKSGVVVGRQRAPSGPGRRVIEYALAQPLELTESDFVGIAELLASALGRAQLDRHELRQIGADWGRYLSGRPARHDPLEHIPRILARFGYRVRPGTNELRLERCLCPLLAPDSPLMVCWLMDGVIEGALAASGGELRLGPAQHDPDARSCRIELTGRKRRS